MSHQNIFNLSFYFAKLIHPSSDPSRNTTRSRPQIITTFITFIIVILLTKLEVSQMRRRVEMQILHHKSRVRITSERDVEADNRRA